MENKPKWQRSLALRINPGNPVPPSLPPQPWNSQRKKTLDYFRTLLAADEGIGRILATLEELGQLDSTLLVFTSDNGLIQGEHRVFEKKLIYEESIRIPLLMRYPPLIAPGQTNQEMVLNLDLAPTFLQLARVPVPDTMQGLSLVPLLSGSGVPWRDSFLYEHFMREGRKTPTMLGIRTEQTKYVTYPDIDDLDELYDLANDPFELNNLAVDPDAGPLLAEMCQRLQHLVVETGYMG